MIPQDGSKDPSPRAPSPPADADPDRGAVLVVEDDAEIRDIEREILVRGGFRAECVGAADEALVLAAHRDYEAVLLDLHLPGAMEGLQLLEALQERGHGAPIVVVTGDSDLRTAIECIRRGAYDFLTKPLDPELLFVTVEKAAEHGAMAVRLAALEHALGEPAGLGALLGRSPAMKKVFMLIRRAAPHDSPVLILGESGCGKEVAAREIHRLSSRSRGPLVPVSCANISRDIQESEFFGHERGAFTGADRKRIGLFETAAGGTIFLDEIAECAPATQAALLRVLQEGEIRPAGSSVPLKVDVRVIAATNVDLEKAAAAGTFRSDLYYRLSRLVVEMPPLRERPEDIVVLAERILAETCERLKRPARQYSPRALEMLLSYPWPGNVRELQNLSEKVALFTPRPIVRPADLQDLDGWDWSQAATVATLDEMERRHIQDVLAKTEGNYKQAAILLAIPRSTLYRKVRRFQLGAAAETPSY
ncbi:MAG: sigma-54-dependent Fis family transcriptional regulator [Acidobacteria bacterium]|nr:sigma-54-dependent Fis family transcriptional regulator [Acidobacteriota bacterium]